MKTYNSQLNNEVYIIYEDTLQNHLSKNIIQNNYYIINGVACSWNCALSFIYDNKHKNKFYLSENLLYKMYKEQKNVEKNKIIRIKPSPHWKLLDVFGGIYSIQEFRNKLIKWNMFIMEKWKLIIILLVIYMKKKLHFKYILKLIVIFIILFDLKFCLSLIKSLIDFYLYVFLYLIFFFSHHQKYLILNYYNLYYVLSDNYVWMNMSPKIRMTM